MPPSSACAAGEACATRDRVRSRAALLLWWLPATVVLVGVFTPAVRPWLWIPALLVMGGACLENAARCRRLHCRITGPLFLAGAAATALDVLDWRLILAGLVLGTALAFGWEWVHGPYGESE